MKKSEIKTIIDDFREFIVSYRFSFGKESTKILIKSIRNYEKIVNDEKEDNIEYLKDQFNSLKNFKKAYLKKKSELTKLIKNYKVKVNISFDFQSKNNLMMNVMCLLKVTIQWSCIQLTLMKYLVN